MFELFHIHTYRCGHAENIKDEEYVKKAMELGASKITFTDHAPFPNNPFSNRMKYEELDEYINSINNLKDKYRDKIEVVCGLEIEYLPSYEDYYKELKSKLDILMLGQHHFEVEKGLYNFQIPYEKYNDEGFFSGVMNAQIKGVKSGFFDVIAHPDRCFKTTIEWNELTKNVSKTLIEEAIKNNVILEKNISSIRKKMYKEEFWEIVPDDVKIIMGIDAHSLSELIVV